MVITWHGNFTIKIVSQGKILIIDPHSATAGLSAVRGKADLVALSNPANPDMSHLSGIQNHPTLIGGAGEYSIDSLVLFAQGWHDAEGNERNLQRWHIEGMVLLHVGALNRKLEDAELQKLEQINIDILLLPIGGQDGLNTKEALELLTTIEPRVVIPINYKIPKLTSQHEPVTQFAKEMGINPIQAVPKYSISANKLPAEGLVTTIISP